MYVYRIVESAVMASIRYALVKSSRALRVVAAPVSIPTPIPAAAKAQAERLSASQPCKLGQVPAGFPKGPKFPKNQVSMVSVFGIAIMALFWGTSTSCFGAASQQLGFPETSEASAWPCFQDQISLMQEPAKRVGSTTSGWILEVPSAGHERGVSTVGSMLGTWKKPLVPVLLKPRRLELQRESRGREREGGREACRTEFREKSQQKQLLSLFRPLHCTSTSDSGSQRVESRVSRAPQRATLGFGIS